MTTDIIKELGGNKQLAQELSVAPNVVANWRMRGSIPLVERFRIAELAKRKNITLPADFLPKVGL